MKVEFKDVSFKYYSSEEYIFEHLSFIIENNGMLAILGHNANAQSFLGNILQHVAGLHITGCKCSSDCSYRNQCCRYERNIVPQVWKDL